MGFLQILTAYSSAPHDAKYLAAQSFSSQLAVFEALFLSPRLGQLYLAVFAGLLLRELKQSRPFIYRFIVHVTHYICYSVCFDLATLAISYFRPQSQEDGASEEGVNKMASYIVRDFWIAFLGHAFVAFAGAYSILLLDTDQALLNNLQAGVGGGWVILGPDATVTVFGGGNMGGATTNANPANNADNHGNNNSFTALLSFVATSFTNIFGLATSTTSFALLPGIGLATLNSVPILSTSFAWLFLLHHFTPTELLPLVVFPCLEASAAWHGRLIAPWFSSASHLAFVYILITGWYNGTASWGLTPFILLCMGKPFLLLLFFSAIAPLIVIRELKKKVVNVWRTWFPLPGVAMANEGPKVISPSSSSGVFPNGSQDSAGRSSQARGGQQALSRKDELLDELDDLIDDALEFGVDASYRQPMLPSSSTISSLPVFTRSRRKCPPSTSSQQVPNNETVPAEDHSEASFSSSSSIRSQQIQASRKNPTPAQPVTGPVDYQTPSVRSGDECVYCWTSPRSVLLEPCAHLCLCNECRDLLASKGENQCPVCRRGVEMYRRIYRA